MVLAIVVRVLMQSYFTAVTHCFVFVDAIGDHNMFPTSLGSYTYSQRKNIALVEPVMKQKSFAECFILSFLKSYWLILFSNPGDPSWWTLLKFSIPLAYVLDWCWCWWLVSHLTSSKLSCPIEWCCRNWYGFIRECWYFCRRFRFLRVSCSKHRMLTILDTTLAQ